MSATFFWLPYSPPPPPPPQRPVNISYTHYSKFKDLHPTAHTYTHSPGPFCVSGGYLISVSLHTSEYVSMPACVCHRWYSVGGSDYCGDQSIASHHVCHQPFPESVGGRGRIKGGLKGKQKEERKGRREVRKVNDGKWPPPQCHMGGGLKESVLHLSHDPSFSIISLSHLLLFFLLMSSSLIFSHFSPFCSMKEEPFNPCLQHRRREEVRATLSHEGFVWALLSGWAL